METISHKLDNLKFFITLLWDAKGIDANTYGQLSQKLTTADKTLEKWLQLLKNEAPATKTGA